MDHAKKNDLFRTSPTHSLGSSGQSSPGDGTGGQEMSQNYQYRSLAYLPGSVHGGASFAHLQPQQQDHQTALVKQEPPEQDSRNHYGRGNARGGLGPGGPVAQQQTILQAANNNQQYSNSTVSSTTSGMQAMAAYVINGTMNSTLGSVVNANNNNNNNSNTSQQCQTPLPLLKSFATPPRYLLPHTTNTSGSKKRMDRGTDEYRKRRERNNVAVRKSREKAKIRSKETEERVKILARENDRLQKKTELLQEELSVLRSLFSNVGVLPEHIHRELAKHMENFQQQHNAMGCM